MLIGNQEEAELIHNWYRGEVAKSPCVPPGWRFLGEGSFRAAYLSPSGVVYKVQKPGGHYGYTQTNQGEYKTWKRLYFGCKMPRFTRLPKMSYFEVDPARKLGVIAIERFGRRYSPWGAFKDEQGRDHYWNDVVNKIASTCQIGDLSSDNLFLTNDGKTLVPTDLGDSR